MEHMFFFDGENKYTWFGLKSGKEDFSSLYSYKHMMPDISHYIEVITQLIKPDFDIDKISNEEKYIFSHLIDIGYIKFTDDNKLSPNIYVFTAKQREELDNVFLEIYDEMKSKISNLHNDLNKMCKDILPEQLNFMINHITYLSFIFCNKALAGFAYYDDKIYKPQDESEYSHLMTSMVLCDSKMNGIKRYSMILKGLNYAGNGSAHLDGLMEA